MATPTTDQAIALLQQGQITAAATAFEQVLRTQPGDALALSGLGHCQMRLGREEDAWQNLQTACRLSDRIGQAFSDLAWLALRRGDLALALSAAERALALNQADGAAQFVVAQWLFAERRYDDAERAFARAATLNPGFVEARYNLGNDLFDQGRLVDAGRHYEAYVRLRPDDAQGWTNLGLVRARVGDFIRARAALEKAVALAPERAKPATLLVGVLKDGSAPDAEMIPALERAAALSPDSVPLRLMLAGALANEERLAEAHIALRRVLALDEENLTARWLQFQLPQDVVAADEAAREAFLARWRDGIAAFERLDLAQPRFAAQADEAATSAANFHLAYLGRPLLEEHERNARVLRRLALAAYPQISEVTPRAIGGGRRRIAVFSASLKAHSASRVWTDTLFALDAQRFDLGAFYPGTWEDSVTARWRGRCSVFASGVRTIPAWSEALREFAPDIVVFLDIGLDRITQVVASLRHAPVQIATWGHPVTSGMASIDYFLSADACEPADGQAHYREALVRLPRLGTFLPLPQAPEAEACGVGGDGALRLLCLQSADKLHPRHDALFAAILKANPTARLDILCGKPARIAERLSERLAAAFARAGVDFATRCAVHARQSPPDYRRFVAAADLCLDALDFSGCLTSLDALWADVPIVTLPGALMRGRQTAAMLGLLGLDELVARDCDDYLHIATRAAQDGDWRRSLVRRIAAGKHRLYDDRSVVDALCRFLADVEPATTRG
ncbi:MAG: tetratricopeptide repeat protein [Rudaea sp.]